MSCLKLEIKPPIEDESEIDDENSRDNGCSSHSGMLVDRKGWA